eukprot:CAMPEP_0202712816 /NCGR_PEP_ID=MMETSP1385-20130828/46127_1 /ASSEMBLY_ACC=CAM_ASM_000861 /TAXON_ID=933848 /ORGANISM="Elphidium margaritaceum" /LENGTH=336 /DNA_ID=CAMNT_0049372979 /DNA_START=28 /DNA_END=1038 /DNA_ORIENTATION=-
MTEATEAQKHAAKTLSNKSTLKTLQAKASLLQMTGNRRKKLDLALAIIVAADKNNNSGNGDNDNDDTQNDAQHEQRRDHHNHHSNPNQNAYSGDANNQQQQPHLIPNFHVDISLLNCNDIDYQAFRRAVTRNQKLSEDLNKALCDAINKPRSLNNSYTTTRACLKPLKAVRRAVVPVDREKIYQWTRNQFTRLQDSITSFCRETKSSALIALHDTYPVAAFDAFRKCEAMYVGGFYHASDETKKTINDALKDLVHEGVAALRTKEKADLKKVAVQDATRKEYQELLAQEASMTSEEFLKRKAELLDKQMMVQPSARRNDDTESDEADQEESYEEEE